MAPLSVPHHPGHLLQTQIRNYVISTDLLSGLHYLAVQGVDIARDVGKMETSEMVREPARKAREGDARGLSGGENYWLAHLLLTTTPPLTSRVTSILKENPGLLAG